MRRWGPLPPLALFACAILPARAQEIVVTGDPLPQLAVAPAYGGVVLGAEQLAAEPSNRLENALQSVAGFQQFRRSDSRSANPTSQGATLRGLGGNAASRALVLLDGVPQADPFGGWIPWNALAPARFSAVRVTRGAGAGPFGAGALGGTIELFTALPTTADLGAQARIGSRRSFEAAAEAGGPLGAGTASAFARYDTGDGFIPIVRSARGAADEPAAYENFSTGARAVAPLAPALELQAAALAFHDDRDRGVESVGSTSTGADASARLVGRGALPFEALAYLQARRFTSTFAAVADDRSSASRVLDQYNTPATGLGGKLELQPRLSDALGLRLGADVRHAEGVTRERFRYVEGTSTRRREAGGASTTLGAFAEASVTPTPALTLGLGGRLDRWWITGGRLVERDLPTATLLTDERPPDRSGWEPTGRAAALYRLTPALSLRAAAYANFRLPTLNELYRPFRVGADATAANPSLDPERLTGAELGLDFAPLPTARLALTLFTNRLDNAIANVTLAEGPGTFPGVGFVAGSYRQRRNLDHIRSRGVELDAGLAYRPLRLDLSYALTDARVRADGEAAALDGLRPAQVPLHQASATLAYTRGRASAAIVARYTAEQFEDDLNQRTLDDAFTLGASAAIPLTPALDLTLAAENLTDTRVETALSDDGVVERGLPRTVWIGLALRR